MPSALTTQTEREIRYEHRLHKKRVDQQTVDRSVRLSNRSNAISDEVSKEIVSIQGKKKRSSDDQISIIWVVFFYLFLIVSNLFLVSFLVLFSPIIFIETLLFDIV